MAERIYKVSGLNKDRLIMAATPSQAIRYATVGMFTASVATQVEIADLVGKGVKVEKASEA